MSDIQKEIGDALHVDAALDVAAAVSHIVEFLVEYLERSRLDGFVLGISGGQDSALCGRLAQISVETLREREPARDVKFIAMRLPYGAQKDEQDAQLALSFIRPDEVITLDIAPAVDAMCRSYETATGHTLSDFHKGNVKARQRMVAQFAVAGQRRLLVLGTDHAAEAVTGFFTKFGDGACDVAPLTGLTKRQGRRMLLHLGGPDALANKVPTADLEDTRPLRPDEEALGVSYDQIDDFLENQCCSSSVERRLELVYRATEHKRNLPVTRFGR